MGHRVRQIQEKRFVLVQLDKGHCFFGIPSGDGVLVSGAFDFLLIAHQRDTPVVDLGVEVGRAIRQARRQVPIHVV